MVRREQANLSILIAYSERIKKNEQNAHRHIIFHDLSPREKQIQLTFVRVIANKKWGGLH